MLTQRRSLPFWIWGLLLALALVVLSLRSRPTINNVALEQQFVPRPTASGGGAALPIPHLDLGQLPAEARRTAGDLQRRLGLGQGVPALTPVAQSPRLRVAIDEVRRVDEGVQVIGTVTNISPAELQVPVSAFELRDSTGASYVAGGSAQARLAPGASTPLDLTVPLPPERGLLLTLRLPPDPPVEQVLLVGD